MKMTEKLALYGGPKTITKSFKRYNSIGKEEVEAHFVLACVIHQDDGARSTVLDPLHDVLTPRPQAAEVRR